MKNNTDPLRVVMVCTGNICRSPMAEALLRHRWQHENGEELIVTSMGIQGLDNAPASELAVTVCAENGIDISSHRSRPLLPEELLAAHYVFCLDRGHKEYLSLFFPHVRDNLHLLGAWPGRETNRSSVKDPMGGNIKVYRRAFSEIDLHIERVVGELLAY